MKTVAIIPARMGSSRFPGKPLAMLCGRPMLEHVYRRVAESRLLDAVCIATCDEEIREAAIGFGATVIMTSATHERATERVAEAASAVSGDIIVMVQGDEPMIHPDMIDEALAPLLAGEQLGCVNLCRRIEEAGDYHDPNTIKVVKDLAGNALYMSRQPVPVMPATGFKAGIAYKQVCVIPFRRDTLMTYTRLPPTPLEVLESVDMLRLIEHGHAVRMVDTAYATQAVDTPADLARVAAMMADDPLLAGR